MAAAAIWKRWQCSRPLMQLNNYEGTLNLPLCNRALALERFVGQRFILLLYKQLLAVIDSPSGQSITAGKLCLLGAFFF